jgi:SH3-like domain-containing protein
MKFLIIFFIFVSYFISNDLVGLGKKNFFSTKYNEVNIRNGPGKKYFIIATLYQKGIPLKKLSVFDSWVQVEDIDGLKGWVSRSQLSDERHAFVIVESTHIHKYPNSKSKKIANLYKNVIVEVLKCKKEWCKIKIRGFNGWINKRYIWGIESNEKF